MGKVTVEKKQDSSMIKITVNGITHERTEKELNRLMNAGPSLSILDRDLAIAAWMSTFDCLRLFFGKIRMVFAKAPLKRL